MRVLFICRGNVGRSKMAEEFFNRISKNNRAVSVGSDNYYYRRFWHGRMKSTDPVVKAMKEVGIDMSRNRIKKLTGGRMSLPFLVGHNQIYFFSYVFLRTVYFRSSTERGHLFDHKPDYSTNF